MIESSIVAWLGFACLVAFASWTGIQVSRALPWKDSSYTASIHLGFGFALAPFLAGFAIMSPIALLPGASHVMNLTVTWSLLLFVGALAKPFRKKNGQELVIKKVGISEYPLGGYLLMWLVMLGVNVVFLPLIQNDALEYSTVGRILFESRDLFTYPAIHPESIASGFYGPWTHPPLYVALIYLSYIIQGHANDPGLMRLIAPWFLLTAVCALTALGRFVSWRVGLLSGILLLSTPLLFLGADSALIDALPVSGMVLTLLALVGLRAKHPWYSLTVGAVLGVALWTHSQAVLFIPLAAVALFFQYGLLRWRRALASVATATGAALFVGAGYYLRNYSLFGSPVSDNPVIFALEKLDWKNYFSYGRGLDHCVAKLQYGVLKGWFCFEAYGLLFWFGAAGSGLILSNTSFDQLKRLVCFGTRQRSDAIQLYFVSSVIFIVYILAVALSTAMGVDLMIRNERYLLVVVPLVCVNAAFGIIQFYASCLRKSLTSKIARFGILSLLFFCVLHWFVFAVYYRWRIPLWFCSNKSESTRLSWFNFYLSMFPNMRLMLMSRSLIPDRSTVLSLRPADMFYAGRRMLSYLDPSLLSFYNSSNSEAALAALQNLGVKYVHMSDYFLPAVYNSELMKILADPSVSKLIWSNCASQLYELADSGLRVGEERSLDLDVHSWTRQTQFKFGGRKAAIAVGLLEQPLLTQESRSEFSPFHRDYSTLLRTGPVEEMFRGAGEEFAEAIVSENLLSVDLEGEGYITLWLEEFNEEGKMVVRDSVFSDQSIRIGDLSLTTERPFVNFKRRVIFSQGTKFFRLGIEHAGKSRVRIKQISISKLVPSSTLEVASLPPKMEKKLNTPILAPR